MAIALHHKSSPCDTTECASLDTIWDGWAAQSGGNVFRIAVSIYIMAKYI